MPHQAIVDRIGLRQFNYHFNFLPKHRLFYVEVSKAACSTVKSFLLDGFLEDSGLVSARREHWRARPHAGVDQHPFVKPYQLGLQAFFDLMNSGDYYVFCVVRHPVTRFLSAYGDEIVNRKPEYERLRSFLSLRGLDADDPALVVTEDVFAQYLDTLTRARDFDQHWRPQYIHVSPDLVRYDKIVRFERLDDDMDAVCRENGLTWDRRKVGHYSTHSTVPDTSRLSAESRDILRRVYADDFTHFGYEPPG